MPFACVVKCIYSQLCSFVYRLSLLRSLFSLLPNANVVKMKHVFLKIITITVSAWCKQHVPLFLSSAFYFISLFPLHYHARASALTRERIVLSDLYWLASVANYTQINFRTDERMEAKRRKQIIKRVCVTLAHCQSYLYTTNSSIHFAARKSLSNETDAKILLQNRNRKEERTNGSKRKKITI